MKKEIKSIDDLYGPRDNWFIFVDGDGISASAYIQVDDESDEMYSGYTDEKLMRFPNLDIKGGKVWVALLNRPISARTAVTDEKWLKIEKKFIRDVKRCTRLVAEQFSF